MDCADYVPHLLEVRLHVRVSEVGEPSVAHMIRHEMSIHEFPPDLLSVHKGNRPR